MAMKQVSGYDFESELLLVDYRISNGVVLNDDLYDFGLIDFISLTSCPLKNFKEKVMQFNAKTIKAIQAKKNVLDFIDKYQYARSLSFESALFVVRDLATQGVCGLSEADVDYIFDELEDNFIPVNNFTFAEAALRYAQGLEMIPCNILEDNSIVKDRVII